MSLTKKIWHHSQSNYILWFLFMIISDYMNVPYTFVVNFLYSIIALLDLIYKDSNYVTNKWTKGLIKKVYYNNPKIMIIMNYFKSTYRSNKKPKSLEYYMQFLAVIVIHLCEFVMIIGCINIIMYSIKL